MKGSAVPFVTSSPVLALRRRIVENVEGITKPSVRGRYQDSECIFAATFCMFASTLNRLTSFAAAGCIAACLLFQASFFAVAARSSVDYDDRHRRRVLGCQSGGVVPLSNNHQPSRDQPSQMSASRLPRRVALWRIIFAGLRLCAVHTE